MTRSGRVGAGQDSIDGAESAIRVDALGSETVADTNLAASGCGMFQRSYDRRADGNDAPAADSSAEDSAGCGRRNAERFVEGKAAVQLDISGRCDSGRVRNGGQSNAASANRQPCLPIQGKSGGRWLEGHGWTRYRRPYIPQSEGRRDMGVLDRPAVVSQAGPDCFRAAVEAQHDETRMFQKALHRCEQRPQDKLISRPKRGGRRSILGAAVKIAGAEHDGRETPDGIRC